MDNEKITKLEFLLPHHDYEPHPDGGCKVCAYPQRDQVHSKPIGLGSEFMSDRLGLVQVVRVHPFGTVDVRKAGTDKYYRISGLSVSAFAGHGAPVFHTAVIQRLRLLPMRGRRTGTRMDVS